MRILLLTHAFNHLTQSIYCALLAKGYQVSVEFDINDAITIDAVALFAPQLIIAPYMRRALPKEIWQTYVCLIVHHGVVGDRGPSALDYAIINQEKLWGVTVLQANAEMDAGDIWVSAQYQITSEYRTKSSIYRQEATDAGVVAVLQAVNNFDNYQKGKFVPTTLATACKQGAVERWRPLMKQQQRSINWQNDNTATICRKVACSDGQPGVADTIFGHPCFIYDVWRDEKLGCENNKLGSKVPGEIIARRESALCRATIDGAVWIGHVKRTNNIKLPATLAFANECATLIELPIKSWFAPDYATWQDIRYSEVNGVGSLFFEFYNGAMSTHQCERLLAAFRWVSARPLRVLVLYGGVDFWSNGIHLNIIENAKSASDESWANINSINDLALEIITTTKFLTIAALRGNAGAGGCFLARAADYVWVRQGVMLNPHYKNMGNLYGSEYWTYLLPNRLGKDGATEIICRRLPMTAQESVNCGFYDDCLQLTTKDFVEEVQKRAVRLAQADNYEKLLQTKMEKRNNDEQIKPLAEYRKEELAEMRRNFYGFDSSYHKARHNFVYKIPHSWTPRHLAKHREIGYSISQLNHIRQ